jgi:hypothetical protein
MKMMEWSIDIKIIDWGKPKYSEIICLSATSSIINPT